MTIKFFVEINKRRTLITKSNIDNISLEGKAIYIENDADITQSFDTDKNPCFFHKRDNGEVLLTQEDKQVQEWKSYPVNVPEWLANGFKNGYSKQKKEDMLSELRGSVNNPDEFRSLVENYKHELKRHNPDKGDDFKNRAANFFRRAETGDTSSWRQVKRLAKNHGIELTEGPSLQVNP